MEPKTTVVLAELQADVRALRESVHRIEQKLDDLPCVSHEARLARVEGRLNAGHDCTPRNIGLWLGVASVVMAVGAVIIALILRS